MIRSFSVPDQCDDEKDPFWGAINASGATKKYAPWHNTRRVSKQECDF